MRNIDEVRQEAISVFKGLKSGTISAKEATEMNNCVGKILNTLKVEMQYAELAKMTPNIPFLHYEKGESSDRHDGTNELNDSAANPANPAVKPDITWL